MEITVGDKVTHNYYDWQGILKVTAINFGTCTLENDKGHTIYYDISNLSKYTEPFDYDQYYGYDSAKKEDPLYCSCVYPHAKIVESSIQVQGSVDKKDTFKYCRTCKKERK